MRVGDEDREHVVAALRRHFAEGKLSLDEFGDRVEAAYAAVSADDLYQSVDGLDLAVPERASGQSTSTRRPAAPPAPPVPPAPPAPPAPMRGKAGVARRSFYAHLGPYVVVNAFLVMIYILASFPGYFWPIWPMMGWGVGLGIHAWAAFVLPDRD